MQTSPSHLHDVSASGPTGRRAIALGRAILSWLVLRVLRVKVQCPETVAEVLHAGGVLVTANHVSMLDGPLIALSSPSPMVFAVDTDYSRRSAGAMRGMGILSRLGCGSIIPLDGTAPFGIRMLVTALRRGGNVMVFPEGRIAVDGPLPAQMGLAWLEQRARPKRIQVTITGAERSRLFAKRGDAWLPRINLEYSVVNESL